MGVRAGGQSKSMTSYKFYLILIPDCLWAAHLLTPPHWRSRISVYELDRDTGIQSQPRLCWSCYSLRYRSWMLPWILMMLSAPVLIKSVPGWNSFPITETEAMCKVGDSLCKCVFKASQWMFVLYTICWSQYAMAVQYVFQECEEMDFLTELSEHRLLLDTHLPPAPSSYKGTRVQCGKQHFLLLTKHLAGLGALQLNGQGLLRENGTYWPCPNLILSLFFTFLI